MIKTKHIYVINSKKTRQMEENKIITTMTKIPIDMTFKR